MVDSDHTHRGTDDHFLAAPLKVSPVRIGSNAFVCANAVILGGAHVGRNSVVAANAMAGEADHPEGWLLAGAPARPIRALGE